MKFSLKKAGILAILFISGLFVSGCSSDSSSTGTEPEDTKQYTVTFDLNGGTGTAPASITKDAGTSITLPTTTSTKSGFKFNGWAEANNATSGLTGSYTVSKDVKLYAVWIDENAKTYKVSFMNGTTEISSTDVPENTSVTKPADLEKENYTFDNWYSDSACTTAFDFSSKINAETKVYAKFTPTEYAITYKNEDGSTISGLIPASYTVEDTVTLPAPTKDGYTFKGWYTDSGFSTAASTSGMSGNKTFYAKWEENTPASSTPSGATYTLTFANSAKVDSDNYFNIDGCEFNGTDALKGNSKLCITFTTSGAATVEVTSICRTDKTGDCGWKISNSSGTAVFTSKNFTDTANNNVQSGNVSSAGTYKIEKTGQEFKLLKVVVTESSGGTPATPVVTSVTLSSSAVTLAPGGTKTITATVNGTNLTTANKTVTWSTDKPGIATVSNGTITAVAVGTAVITATSTFDTSKKATCTVTVSNDPLPTNVIKYTDKPLGFAGVNYTLPSFTAAKTVTVSTRNDLMSYVTKGGYLIYIDGMIDMSDEGTGSKLPAEGASNIAVSSVMDSWIAAKTSNNYKTYEEWVEAYAAVCTSKSANDKEKNPSEGSNTSLYDTVWALNKAWQAIIEIKPKSNTTIIGLGNNSGIRGGTINISGVSNVVIRNLTLIDAIDMFPHHEYDDGFNAQFDCITIQGSNTANIWIDHCTMKDTLVMQHVKSGTKEKWQNYDGLCDIKGDGKGITVSNCHMYHHDKTMLVGSSDSEGDNTIRKVSIINNHFDSCVQRLPMARNSQFHVLNNWYSFDTTQSVGDGKQKGDYCIGARKGALIISEANYFDSNMQYSIRGNSGTKSTTQVYDTGSVDKNSKKTDEYTAVATAPFTVPYSYTPMTAEAAKTYVEDNAGAGKWTVQQ